MDWDWIGIDIGIGVGLGRIGGDGGWMEDGEWRRKMEGGSEWVLSWRLFFARSSCPILPERFRPMT